MTEQLIDFKTAVLARKKGFDEPCRNNWWDIGGKGMPINPHDDNELVGSILSMFVKHKGDFTWFTKKLERLPKLLKNSINHEDVYSRPTQDLLERWFREKHGIIPGQYVVQDKGQVIGYAAVAFEMEKVNPSQPLDKTIYASFEEAREASLQHALNLLS